MKIKTITTMVPHTRTEWDECCPTMRKYMLEGVMFLSANTARLRIKIHLGTLPIDVCPWCGHLIEYLEVQE